MKKMFGEYLYGIKMHSLDRKAKVFVGEVELLQLNQLLTNITA